MLLQNPRKVVIGFHQLRRGLPSQNVLLNTLGLRHHNLKAEQLKTEIHSFSDVDGYLPAVFFFNFTR